MYAFGVVGLVCILFCFARLVDLVYFAYADGLFCSMYVHSVCFVHCVFSFSLPVLLIWFTLYLLMVSSVQCVCVWCVLFIV